MEGGSAKKCTSLETLVIQNITNVTDLKEKLNDIINAGKDYEYDVSACMRTLLNNNDGEIVCLTAQAIAELSKCDTKRETYANKDIIQPILNMLERDVTLDTLEILKQCCRALGNLCCNCDSGRKVILELSGVATLINLLKKFTPNSAVDLDELKLIICKCILNFCIGGHIMTTATVDNGIINILQTLLEFELTKGDMNDDIVTTAILILTVINDNAPEFLFEPEVNCTVLQILKETTNIEISELCLDHLHMQTEHDSVKTLIATKGGVQLVCSRLELLVARQAAEELNADEYNVEAIMKQACDLIIIVLTGDEAMNLLYDNGVGEVYLTMIKWLDSTNHNLLTTAVLAIGNFARQDEYCVQMMENKIFDKLLDIFELYLEVAVRIRREPGAAQPVDEGTATRLQHAALAAVRNLAVPAANKRAAAGAGRAARVLLAALPLARDPHVAYKLLAALRMLVDGQEGVARLLAADGAALAAAARWGGGGGGGAGGEGGAGAEAPRLLAWAARQLHRAALVTRFLQVEGCVTCLVNMLVASHSVMQNEAILALTLLAIESLNNKTVNHEESPEIDYEKSFITQIIKSEIGKHISVLIETHCAKLPIEVAENILAFLDITAKKSEVVADYREAKVNEALQKFVDTRKDLSDNIKNCIAGITSLISDNGDNEVA